ncbi:MAG TPA: hypothetical protein VF363_05795 [Candidatus Eisenbacteria bacterium]
MRTVFALIAALAVALGALPALAETPEALRPLSFLLGDWRAGANAGAPGQGSGGCAFRLDLQDRVIVRTNHAEYPAAGGRPAVVHDDLMVIYPGDGGALRADYYDNEGHVIRYGVTAAAEGVVTFLSDASAPGPRYRLTYRRGNGVVVEGRFEMAPPDKPDEFKTYTAWEMTMRVKGW